MRQLNFTTITILNLHRNQNFYHIDARLYKNKKIVCAVDFTDFFLLHPHDKKKII